MFGVPMKERAERVTEIVTTLKAAFSGEPFEYRGRTVQVTPEPLRVGRPEHHPRRQQRSRRRGGRRASPTASCLLCLRSGQFYRDEVQQLGRPDPGRVPIGENRTVFLAEDPAKAWEQMGPYFLHEANSYGAWQAEDDVASPYRTSRTSRRYERPGSTSS